MISPRAEEDLIRNARWWSLHHSSTKATEWLRTVREQILALNQSPLRHGLARENDQFPYEMRNALVGLGTRKSFRAVFTIRGDEIYVLAVMRGSQDELPIDDVNM